MDKSINPSCKSLITMLSLGNKRGKMVTINFEKKHLYIFSALIGIFIGILFVNAFGTNNPPVFGHSVGEIFWGDTIDSNVLIGNGRRLFVGGEIALQEENDATRRILVGSTSGGGGLGLFGGGVERISILTNGNVGIGDSNPVEKLHVEGNLYARGKIYNLNTCREIHDQNSPGSGAIPVPTECINNLCLIVIVEGPRIAFVHYRQEVYDINGNIINVGTPSAAGKSSNMFAVVWGPEAGINGDSVSNLILSVITLSGGPQIHLNDDGFETNANEWSWDSQGTGFKLYACY